jgi:hypothetical protein
MGARGWAGLGEVRGGFGRWRSPELMVGSDWQIDLPLRKLEVAMHWMCRLEDGVEVNALFLQSATIHA